ncbi:MAG TPA: hypothetical protein PKE69_02985 [Pyrinomonadaceae bacterium]|nr:hypothetical protein [Pyrinomonadaceae bacterium]
MMHTKAIISIFILICISNIFVFSQQKQLFQNIFKITNNPIGVEILNSQADYQTLEVTDDIAYQQLFRLLLSFEKEAAKQTNEGYSKRAELLRGYFQRKAGLTFEQAKLLKDYALNFTTRFGCISTRGESEKYDSEKSKGERSQAVFEYRNSLRQLLGESSFDRFDKFVQEKITSRIIYTKNLATQEVNFGYSMVDYYGDEVIGYSSTDEPAGHCVMIENTVLATLSSDAEGIVAYDAAEMCGGAAEVYLYYSNPQPEDRFCVDGEHYFVSSYGLPFNDSRRKSNLGACYSGKVESLPPSENCLTIPPLPNVTGVSFQPIAQNSLPINENPNTGGGLRVFPDDNTPGETANRQTIQVRASIDEARAGVTVHFLNFDLDDPSDNPDVDPDGNGNDNHGSVMNSSAGRLITTQAQTNSQGIATVNFTVTMQPGDNFAIAASTDSTELPDVTMDGINLLNGSGATIETTCDGTDIVCRSEMLTVWRRLHIEVDSMGDVSGNLVSGATPNEVRVRRNATEIITLNNTLEPNRFENGRFVIGGSSLEVTQNTTNTITVRNNNQPTVYAPANSQFQLYDDDNFDDGIGLLNGDIGEDIPMPNTNRMTANSDDATANVFAHAYVRPVYDVGDNNDSVPFFANVENNEITDLFDTYFTQQATHTGSDAGEFWTIYLLGGYQYTTASDGDPRRFNSSMVLQNVYGAADVPERARTGRGAIIFTEEGRNTEYPAGWTDPPVSRAYTVGHEVGHLFGCIHNDGGLMSITQSRTSGVFTPICLNQIRTATHP